jgi:thiol-disulfide isomerase/thioredoxin
VKKPLRRVALAVGIVVVAFAALLAVNVDTDPRASLNTTALLGKAAPPFTVTRFDGTKVTTADVAGKTVVVNFWNTWCEPCRQELPALQRWYAEHGNEADVVMLGIPRDEPSRKDLRDEVRRAQMGWAVQDDRGARAANLAFGTRGQPETFVISPNGVVVGSAFGPVTGAQLDRMVRFSRTGR